MAHCPVGADNKRNLVATGFDSNGDVEAKFAECDLVLERTYHTKANCQTMMETFRSYAYMDLYGRLTVVSSTQIPFHNRRILGNALGIPKSKIRIIKPRVGGGFGAKTLEGITEIPDIAIGARYHHERFDGRGYPDGLSGMDIPEIARIIGVADAYDAMTSNRSYRGLMAQEDVRGGDLPKGKGTARGGHGGLSLCVCGCGKARTGKCAGGQS